MKWILLGVAAIALIELVLRIGFGFGTPLLYLGDPEIGYLLAPNQSVRRFGNRIKVNSYSMRSDAISLKPPAGTRRILLLGDSIVNGGWWTDQAKILSEVMARQAHQPTEVFNASANSWAPRNELAYLQRFGVFNADVVVLVINTDDLFGTVPSSRVVGHHHNYPDRKPFCAIAEVIQRYLFPISPGSEAVQAETGDRVGANLAAISQIHRLVKQNHAEFLLAMTPLLRELEPPGSRDYERVARQRLWELTQAEAIAYLDFLPIFERSQPKHLYRDHIHLSELGTQRVSESIIRSIEG
jgi:lysophospholipase L1-like esterase